MPLQLPALTVKENNVVVVLPAFTLDFTDPLGTLVTESPSGEANILLTQYLRADGQRALIAGAVLAFRDSDDSHETTFTAGDQLVDIDYTLPDAPAAVDGYVLTSTTLGVLSWSPMTGGGSTIIVQEDDATVDAAAGTIDFTEPLATIVSSSPAGEANINLAAYLLASGARALAGNLDFANNLAVNIGAAGTDFTAGGGLNLAEQLKLAAGKLLRFDDSDSSNFSAFQAGNQTTDVTYTLPTAAPAVTGHVLSATTAGVMSWIAMSGGSLTVQEDDVDVDTAVTTIDFTEPLATVVSSSPAGEANVNLAAYLLASGARALSGNLDLASNLVLNIGAAGTDFVAGGGLTLASTLTLTGFTTGSVLFIGASAAVAQDNTQFFWNDTLKTLTIGSTEDTITIDGGSETVRLSVHDQSSEYLYGAHHHSGTASAAGRSIFARSRGSEASETVVSSGDLLGAVQFAGHDGTDYEIAAEIACTVDGSVGAGDMPGRLSFSTSLDGTAAPAEAMRITNAGLVRSLLGLQMDASQTLRFRNPADTFQTTFVAGAQGADINYTWPIAPAAVNGYILSSTTAGVLSWIAPSAGSALIVQEDDTNVDTAVATLDFTEPLATIVTSSPAGEANVDLSQYLLASGARALGGTLDLANNLIVNIGDAGTDFTAGGGLNLAGLLAVGTGGTFTLATGAGDVAISGDLEVEGQSRFDGTIGWGTAPLANTIFTATVTSATIINAINLDLTVQPTTGIAATSMNFVFKDEAAAASALTSVIGIASDTRYNRLNANQPSGSYALHAIRVANYGVQTGATITGGGPYTYHGISVNAANAGANVSGGTHTLYDILTDAAPTGFPGGTRHYSIKLLDDSWIVDNAIFFFGTSEDCSIVYDGGSWIFDVLLATTAIVFNESGLDTDFRIESDAQPNMFFLDAGANRIGLGTAAPGSMLELEDVTTLGAGLGDGVAAMITLDPGYTGAFTVTRHNYLKLENVSVAASAVVTDACSMWFDAAAGTHKALDAGTTKVSMGVVTAWEKKNIAGTVMFTPLYSSKTS